MSRVFVAAHSSPCISPVHAVPSPSLSAIASERNAFRGRSRFYHDLRHYLPSRTGRQDPAYRHGPGHPLPLEEDFHRHRPGVRGSQRGCRGSGQVPLCRASHFLDQACLRRSLPLLRHLYPPGGRRRRGPAPACGGCATAPITPPSPTAPARWGWCCSRTGHRA